MQRRRGKVKLVLIVGAPHTKTDTASGGTDPDVSSAAIADWRDAH
jgi:hypothetical protein